MRSLFRLKQMTIMSLHLVLLASGTAHAQMSNKPFVFKNTPGGIGMSVGGKQAIFNEKFFGEQPHNLVRDSSGNLLDIQNGPGRNVFVSYPGTDLFIPNYRGSSFKGARSDMTAGVFNAFFSPSSSGRSSVPYPQIQSGETISTWTTRVASGNTTVSYSGDSVVDNWTSQVCLICK